MGTRPPRPAAIATAIAFALSVFGFTLFVWNSFGGPIPFTPKGYTFHVRFGTDAVQLYPNAQARISGVPVGRVVSVAPVEGRIDAEIQLERQFAPIPSDARAIVRAKTLLGETFVELTPGSKSAPKLREGGVLPIENVGRAQGLDEVLGSFDPPTRRALKVFLADVATALEGRGEDVNAALGNAAPATAALRKVVESLDRQRPAVRRLLRDAGIALAAIGRRDDDVQSLVTAGDEVLAATAARDRELTQTIQALPPFLTELRATFAALEATSDEARPTLAALAPVAPLIRPALDETSALAPVLRSTFRELDPIITRARTGLPAATRTVNSLKPLLNIAYPAARELIPVGDLLDAYKRELLTVLVNLGATTQGTSTLEDGSELHYARVLPPLNNEGPLGQKQREPTNRHNPYLRPGGLAEIARGGLLAWDCRNVDNVLLFPPIGTGAPECREQPPFEFRGMTRKFPHVERDGP